MYVFSVVDVSLLFLRHLLFFFVWLQISAVACVDVVGLILDLMLGLVRVNTCSFRFLGVTSIVVRFSSWSLPILL